MIFKAYCKLFLILFFFISYEFNAQIKNSEIEKNVSKLNSTLQIKITPDNDFYKKLNLFYNKDLSKVIGLSNFYSPLFCAKLKFYELPIELQYLPIVESKLYSVAKSKAGAKGLWQFMNKTGYQLGLYENKYVNLFYDPIASTDAACRYLKYLYQELKDWKLALAAYNCGIGRVKSIIKKKNTTDYNVIYKYLPIETQMYIPSFYAVLYLMNFYEYHNIEANRLIIDYNKVYIKKALKNTLKEDLFTDNKIFKKYFNFLNPHIKTSVIPKDTVFYYISDNQN